MTVVAFPDEIIRLFLDRLDQSPRFPIYLNALQLCARRQLDPGALHRWWRANAGRIESDGLELDFVAFLNRIIVSEERWEEAKRRVQESLKRSSTESSTDEGSIENLAKSLINEMTVDQARRERFVNENPEYRCVDSDEQWHKVFEQIFGANDPLKIIARWCAQLLPCGLPKSLREDDYVSGWSDAGRFGMEDERPAAFLIGSPAHAHLLELSAWISEQIGRPQLRNVLDWSLNNEWMGVPPESVFKAACQCSHALFAHLMLYKEVQPGDPDSLICLLQLPLALSASASGPPHLVPDFGFLGAGMFFDSATSCMEQAVGRDDLTAAWGQFFEAYKRLRLRGNGGRGFPGCEYIYHIALTSFRGDGHCWRDENGKDCIAASIREMNPDITILLEYFLEYFINNVYVDILEDEARVNESAELRTFSGRNAFVPVVAALRKESLHELASAVLSYYLVITTVVGEGNLDEMTGLDESLITSRGLPGYRLIETTLEFICALAEKKGHPLTRMKFAQFLIPSDQRMLQLIGGGENETCEFKSTLRTNLHTGAADRAIEHAALKTLAAFLNKRGGSLLIGVEDGGTVIGLAKDQFPNTDKLILHFKNLIQATMPDALDLIRFTVVPAEGREVLLVECERGKRPIYLKNRDTKDDEFYVRRGPSTDRLGMRDAFAYIQSNFPDYDPATNG